MLRLEWEYALPAFLRLKEESKWSQSYYAYLCGGKIKRYTRNHVTLKRRY